VWSCRAPAIGSLAIARFGAYLAMVRPFELQRRRVRRSVVSATVRVVVTALAVWDPPSATDDGGDGAAHGGRNGSILGTAWFVAQVVSAGNECRRGFTTQHLNLTLGSELSACAPFEFGNIRIYFPR
jgi:hypothetical protein